LRGFFIIKEKNYKRINMNKDKYFRTTNFYFAVFLYAKGFIITGIDKTTSSNRAIFAFEDSPNIRIASESFKLAKEGDLEVIVDARKFIQAVKELKDKLYQDEF